MHQDPDVNFVILTGVGDFVKFILYPLTIIIMIPAIFLLLTHTLVINLFFVLFRSLL